MRWSKVALGGGAAALAGAAAVNASAARGGGALPNLIGGEEGWYAWRGHRIAWTRRGSGPALLLVHAIHAAAWSYEWRRAVDALARDHTVWTLDLLGFGRSDRPRLRYTAALYVALVTDFLAEQIGEPTTLVASSLSGAHAVAVAQRDAARVPALVLVCPTGVTHLASPPGPVNDFARAFVDSPGVGSTVFNALVTRPSMRGFLSQTYADSGHVTPELLDAYWATTHQPGARHAVAAFVGMQLNLNVRDALRRLEQPLLITWGDRTKEVPMTELEAYRALRPEAEVRMFSPSGSLPHDERAAEWCAAVLDFTARHVGAGLDLDAARPATAATGTADARPADGRRSEPARPDDGALRAAG